MTNKELQDAINETNDMFRASRSGTQHEEDLFNHLLDLLDVQLSRAKDNIPQEEL